MLELIFRSDRRRSVAAVSGSPRALRRREGVRSKRPLAPPDNH
jgi:hypothetical protein